MSGSSPDGKVERKNRYAQAIHDDAERLSAERRGIIPGVMEVADAEQAELRHEVELLKETLREVLSQIHPQGHSGWGLNTCLVTDDQLNRWRQVAEQPSIARRKQ